MLFICIEKHFCKVWHMSEFVNKINKRVSGTVGALVLAASALATNAEAQNTVAVGSPEYSLQLDSDFQKTISGIILAIASKKTPSPAMFDKAIELVGKKIPSGKMFIDNSGGESIITIDAKTKTFAVIPAVLGDNGQVSIVPNAYIIKHTSAGAPPVDNKIIMADAETMLAPHNKQLAAKRPNFSNALNPSGPKKPEDFQPLDDKKTPRSR
jgi:hypothetical protein